MNIQPLRSLSFLVRFIILGGMLALSAACSGKGELKHDVAPPPATVIVVEASQRTVPIYSEFVGQTRADETVELRARVEGILLKVHFKEGSSVRKGQLLFTIDKRPFSPGSTYASPSPPTAVDVTGPSSRNGRGEASMRVVRAGWR